MIDFSTLKELYVDGKKVTSLFLDGHEVPVGGETPKYFTVTALEQSATVSINKNGTPPAFSLEYSRSADLWSSYSAEQTITLAAGESVMFRRVGEATTTFSSGTSNYWHFTFNSSVKVSGNIMSLLDASMQSTTVGAYAFYRLFFRSGSLVDASELELPATTLADSCYRDMFSGCTSLSAVPTLLPATTLADNCYSNMFNYCTSLSAFPTLLPATTLASSCYNAMFGNCTSLSAAPVLPATTLANYCYQQMFYKCSSLASAPALPATTLASNCYSQMFQNCKSLSTAPALPATTFASSCYNSTFMNCYQLTSVSVDFTGFGNTNTINWLASVKNTIDGIFTCTSALGTDATIQRGVNYCPTEWRVANYDVNGYDMQNAFIRGNYATAFLEDGSSHVPDVAALSVFNGQTAERLHDMTQYTVQLPADTTTAGTKTIQLNGSGDYFGTKELFYRIIAKNISNCRITISSVYDNDEVSYLEVFQTDTGYTLVEGTDYTVAVSTSGDQSTVTITCIGSWTGTYTTTVVHKTSGTSPITVYKHDSSDTKPLKVTLRSRSFSENVSLQCKADSNAWTAMNVDTLLTASSQVQIRAVDANRRLAAGDSNYLWIDTGYNDSNAAAAAVSGNIMSLVDRSETQDRISADYTFAGTFANNDNLIDASHLSCSQVSSNVTRALRAVCAGRGKGYGILNGNPSKLTAAPDLFANVSAYGNNQYQMGDSCAYCPAISSAAMTIPAFAQSTSNSYSIGNAYFERCTSLTAAVVKSHNGDGYVPSYFKCLEATFANCSNLTCISTDISSWPYNGFQNWVQGVAATGTFICPSALGTDATIQRGTSYCPTGWTVVNYDAT